MRQRRTVPRTAKPRTPRRTYATARARSHNIRQAAATSYGSRDGHLVCLSVRRALDGGGRGARVDGLHAASAPPPSAAVSGSNIGGAFLSS
eukprot:5485540-Prymnesium_polylepis.2